MLNIENKSKCEVCDKVNYCFGDFDKKNFIYIDELELNLCLECYDKYENNICLSCNKKILDKDFVSDCFCKKCFD